MMANTRERPKTPNASPPSVTFRGPSASGAEDEDGEEQRARRERGEAVPRDNTGSVLVARYKKVWGMSP